MHEIAKKSLPGIPVLLLVLLGLLGSAALFLAGIGGATPGMVVASILLGLALLVSLAGFYTLEPNQAGVLSLFGR